jgi:hypothetical protein
MMEVPVMAVVRVRVDNRMARLTIPCEDSVREKDTQKTPRRKMPWMTRTD